MEDTNPFRDELKKMPAYKVLEAIRDEREARNMERLELAFEESVRRELWAQPRIRRHYRHWWQPH